MIHNKTFFFGGYQGRYLRQSSTATNTLPLPAFLTGDFSAVPGLALYDPASSSDPRRPYSDRQQPAHGSSISPIAQKLNAYLTDAEFAGNSEQLCQQRAV